MQATRRREAIVLSEEQIRKLERILCSRNSSRSTIVRARVLLRYTRGEAIKAIARSEGISRPTVQLCIDKALSGGIETAIQDLVRPGRPRTVTPEGRAWIMQLACSRPNNYGYPGEIWTLSRLAAHVRSHALRAGHGCLENAPKYIIRRIIKESSHCPHNVAYYFDKESLAPREGTTSLLLVTKKVQLFQKNSPPPTTDDPEWEGRKSGMANEGFDLVADLAPEQEWHPLWYKRHEQKQLSTVNLTAGIDLLDGRVIALVHNKNERGEVGNFLKTIDACYPSTWRIRIVPGTGVAASSRTSMKALKDYPNRFELDEQDSEGRWLILLEVFFTRMITSFLRSLRVKSQSELIDRINQYLDEINLFTLQG